MKQWNAHSVIIAVKGIIDLYHYIKREEEVNEKDSCFSNFLYL